MTPPSFHQSLSWHVTPYGRRLNFPQLRMNVAKDSFVSIAIALGLCVLPLLFVVFVLPQADMQASLERHRLSPDGVVCVAMVVLVAALTLLIATVIGDPGMVWPALGVTSPQQPPHSGVTQSTMEQLHASFSAGEEVTFCRVCHVFVERFDHHCGIIGACIGRRNMWSFIGFLASVAAMGCLGAVFGIWYLWIAVSSHGTSLEAVSKVLVPALTAGVCAIGSLHGGGYCAVLVATYLHQIAAAEDSWALRHRHPRCGDVEAGSVRTETRPRSWMHRVKLVFGEARRFRTAYEAVRRMDALANGVTYSVPA